MRGVGSWIGAAGVAVLTAGVGLAWAGTAAPAITREQAAFFEAKVRPVLAARCYACHSGETPAVQGGLRLDSRAAILAGGGRGSAVHPGDPEGSLLIRTVRGAAGTPRMPPDGKISKAEVEALAAWVKMGAPWPAARPAPVAPKPDPRAFWAWKSPVLPPLPAVKNASWVRAPLDRFVLARLEQAGLKPAPAADRRTLIRRATFDLIGLPPTPDEVRAFLEDRRPDAYERVIDRLLASPAYGERWGRHWLDVARYADSNGVDENLVYLNAWRYRDYVIRAFNQDRPIDRFIQEQLAGDLLPPTGDPDAELDRVVATGFLSLGPKMLAEDDPVKQEEDIIDEQIDTVGRAFMGLTLGCARCHDHKFDPFPQTDYYALAGIFKSTRTMLNFKNMAEWQERPVVGAAERERLAGLDQRGRTLRAERERLQAEETEKLLRAARNRAEDYRAAARDVLRAVSAEPLRPLEGAPDALHVEAEEFLSGNVLKDRDGYGRGIGVLVNAGRYPNVTEYEVTLPQAGLWQLDLRYASGDARPIRVFLNGRLAAGEAAGRTTGGFYPQHQQWHPEGVFRLPAGKCRVRFERDSYFPHLDRFALTPFRGDSYPRTREQVASEAGLAPELLAQAEAQVREGGPQVALTFEAAPGLERSFPEPARAALARLDGDLAAIEKQKMAVPRAMAVSDGKPATMRVHLRGDYQTLGEECPRTFPAILRRADDPPVPAASSGRLELARWMTRPDHPLTARVFVNRVWRWHFGRGLVPSTDNFGTLGDKPANQALLDHLAVTFARDGWSLKRLHRRIMLSATYRMSAAYDARSAARDPENALLWRYPRRRLEAEAIRDSILFVSGRLDRTMGGSLLTFKEREYVTSTANRDPVDYHSRRRSVYLPVIRSALFDFYTAFDFGDPTVLNGDRSSTTVAPQALFMMNSRLVLEETRALATRLLDQAGDDAARIRLAYETCLARPPTSDEVSRALALLDAVSRAPALQGEDAESRRIRAWQSLCKGLLSTNEFLYVD
jgi:hypothetical protein